MNFTAKFGGRACDPVTFRVNYPTRWDVSGVWKSRGRNHPILVRGLRLMGAGVHCYSHGLVRQKPPNPREGTTTEQD